MQIKWLRMALENLEHEALYIARENPQAAREVVQKIHRCVSLLKNNPSLGHAGRVLGTYELIVPDTRYIIPYRVRPRLQHIEILRIFHASRKPPEHW
ncbi:MAG: type II toxin-antitoxin system RelE/ParE family toxin [Gammaproteobacteria bacterium]|nr:type II toxin-antitoxin system RelE/ParE family toxin [Gammaproteobacteria bacterium]